LEESIGKEQVAQAMLKAKAEQMRALLTRFVAKSQAIRADALQLVVDALSAIEEKIDKAHAEDMAKHAEYGSAAKRMESELDELKAEARMALAQSEADRKALHDKVKEHIAASEALSLSEAARKIEQGAMAELAGDRNTLTGLAMYVPLRGSKTVRAGKDDFDLYDATRKVIGLEEEEKKKEESSRLLLIHGLFAASL
jgi:hypothetical protein